MSKKNEYANMDVWLDKKRWDMEWLYIKRYWCDTCWEKDNWKLIKVIWTCAKKAIEANDEESKSHSF